MKPTDTDRLMAFILCGVFFWSTAVIANADEEKATKVIMLWPKDAASQGSKGMGTPKPDRGDGHIRLTDVTKPSLRYFPAPTTKKPRPAVILCPGGGYNYLVTTKMTPIAKWLNEHGISAFILRYRAPKKRKEAFQDVQRAVRIVRSRASEWNIDPRRIGVIGSSAGGHLAARVSTGFDIKAYEEVDELDAVSCKPDFTVLLYPAYMNKGEVLSQEFTVSNELSPTLIVSAKDDKGFFTGSQVYAEALKEAGASIRVHFFEKGGHGFTLRPKEHPLSTWPDLCLQWFRDEDIIEAANEKLRAPKDNPNVIFIMADDLGWQDVGRMGAKLFETPNIDELAADGMTFSRAYSSGPNCAPTRACLMSGLYTPRHKIFTPGGKSKGDPKYMRLLVPAKERKDKALEKKASAQVRSINGLNGSFICIPEVLKKSGYTTARFGKWHLGSDTQGFDFSSSDGLSGEGQHSKSWYGDIDVAENLTNRSVKFIEENRDKPFFLYLAHWDVHIPLRARENVVKKYRAKLNAMPPAELDELKKRIPGYSKENVPVYAAMVEAVDTSVKRVVAKVEELGLEKNTLIFFTSDNGGTSISQLAPLRATKGSLFEAGVRVPAFARWTGQIKPGTESDTPISSVDFLPTMAKLAGAPLPIKQPVDGTDISPLFFGEQIKERGLFWHYPLYLRGHGLEINTPDGKYSWRGFPSTSLVRGNYKMINFLEDQSFALYDLSKDAGEQNNIIDSMPELASHMKKEITAWQKKVKAPIPTTPNPECVLK